MPKKTITAIILVTILPLVCAEHLWAEEEKKTVDIMLEATQAIASQLEPSYLTLFGGYDFTDTIKPDDIFYEGQIYTHLNWWNSQRKKQIDSATKHFLQVYVPIRLQVRQYQTESSPVKTPSFNPGVRLFYLNRGLINSASDFHYFSAGFHHYSNGQSGPHYNQSTGKINTENGSFSSDYLEFSYYRMNKGGLFDWYKLNGRLYLTSLTWEEAQTDYYENALLESSAKMIFDGSDKIAVQLHLGIGYKFGRRYVSPRVEADTHDNIQALTELSIKPICWNWQDMSLFIRWDLGYDYYNINYQNRINRIQFGFIGTVF